MVGLSFFLLFYSEFILHVCLHPVSIVINMPDSVYFRSNFYLEEFYKARIKER